MVRVLPWSQAHATAENPMPALTSLRAVLTISLMGVAFSGVLTWRELAPGGASGGCTLGGAPGTLLGYPACVYGLLMYAALAVVAALGLRGLRHAR